jgi:hypothetical protein
LREPELEGYRVGLPPKEKPPAWNLLLVPGQAQLLSTCIPTGQGTITTAGYRGRANLHEQQAHDLFLIKWECVTSHPKNLALQGLLPLSEMQHYLISVTRGAVVGGTGCTTDTALCPQQSKTSCKCTINVSTAHAWKLPHFANKLEWFTVRFSC